MVSSPGGVSDRNLREKEELLEEICRLFESALAAAGEGDLEGASAPAPMTERILARLVEVDRRIPPGHSSPRADGLLEKAKGLHASLLRSLEKNKEDLAGRIEKARAFRRMLKGYRRPPSPTGRRLDVTDQ